MAGKATIRASLNILSGSLNYRPADSSFTIVVNGSKGPTPGAITVTTEGTDVDLSQLTTPGLCRMKNLDSTNYVEYGIWSPLLELFLPLGEIGPGEFYDVKLSRNLGIEYLDTGTGTTGRINKLRFKANHASVNVSVEAFEK